MALTVDAISTGVTAPLAPEDDHYRRILRWEQANTRRWGKPRLSRYLENRHYFFGENEDADDIKQPLGIRYVPAIIQKHINYLWGEWTENIIDFQASPWLTDDPEDEKWKTATKIEKAIDYLLQRSDANEMFYRGSLNGAIYGDTIFKVSWDPIQQRSRIESVLPEYYHAIWHALNPGQTLEAVVAFPMDRATAASMYRTPGSPGFLPYDAGLHPQLATVWEWWSAYEWMVAVDDKVVLKGDNLYTKRSNNEIQPGMLPFIHIPNLPVDGEYYGFGDAEPIFKLADELNYRLADMGDIINYHAHPITVLEGFFGNTTDLPVAVDAVWSLGRDGKAHYLEWDGPPPAVMEYVEMLMRIMLETTSLTMVAFGRIEQSQASSAALNIQMLPITEVVKRKRAVWGPRLRDLVIKLLTLEWTVLELEDKGKFARKYGFELKELADYKITPKWAPIIPRDRLAVVNEQVALISNKARSIMESLIQLNVDDPVLERSRILQDIRDIAEIEADFAKDLADHNAEIQKSMPQPAAATGTAASAAGSPKKPSSTQRGGKNSDKASGGSNTDGGN